MSIADFCKYKLQLKNSKNHNVYYDFQDMLLLCRTCWAFLKRMNKEKGFDDKITTDENSKILSDVIKCNISKIIDEWKFARATTDPEMAFKRTVAMQGKDLASQTFDIILNSKK